MNRLTINEEKTVTILGMGSPTIQGSNIFKPIAEIDPIFRGYLHHLKGQGQKHIYISLQNRNNSENYRNKEIMGLQSDPQFKDSFYAITLAKNSAFYKCKEGSSPDQCSEFKEKLHAQLFDADEEKSGCYISPEILKKIPDMETRSRRAIDAIAQMMRLKDGDNLSFKQKKFFINMYYNMISLIAMTELDADFMNFTCKDGIDRGMGSLGWFLTLYIYLSQKENSPEAFKLLQDTLLTRAYWARKRTINKEHFERYHNDLSFLLGNLKLNAIEREAFRSQIAEICPKLQSLDLKGFPRVEFPQSEEKRELKKSGAAET
jgi:hypothetical protein